MKPADKAPGGSGSKPGRDGKCAVCGKPVVKAYRPFCSKRCADIDLGRWLGEGYAIPGPPADVRDTGSREE